MTNAIIESIVSRSTTKYGRENDGNCPRLASKGADHGRVRTEDRIGPQIDQLFCQRPHSIRITGNPAKFDPEIAAFRPPQLRERPPESRQPRLRGRIALCIASQHADQPHSLGLLRVGHERPSDCRATDERDDELAPSHRLLRGSGQGIIPAQTSTLEGPGVRSGTDRWATSRCPRWVIRVEDEHPGCSTDVGNTPKPVLNFETEAWRSLPDTACLGVPKRRTNFD